MASDPHRRHTPAITAAPLTPAGFAPFGEVIEAAGPATALINGGRCERFTDLARLDAVEGRIGLSLFRSQLCRPPYRCDLLERHPLGSQCFVPMGDSAYLVVVAEDRDGAPGTLAAFLAQPDQAVNIARNTWHGVLTPVSGAGLFGVLDRIGPGANLQEHPLDPPVAIALPAELGAAPAGIAREL